MVMNKPKESYSNSNKTIKECMLVIMNEVNDDNIKTSMTFAIKIEPLSDIRQLIVVVNRAFFSIYKCS